MTEGLLLAPTRLLQQDPAPFGTISGRVFVLGGGPAADGVRVAVIAADAETGAGTHAVLRTYVQTDASGASRIQRVPHVPG